MPPKKKKGANRAAAVPVEPVNQDAIETLTSTFIEGQLVLLRSALPYCQNAETVKELADMTKETIKLHVKTSLSNSEVVKNVKEVAAKHQPDFNESRNEIVGQMSECEKESGEKYQAYNRHLDDDAVIANDLRYNACMDSIQEMVDDWHPTAAVLEVHDMETDNDGEAEHVYSLEETGESVKRVVFAHDPTSKKLIVTPVVSKKCGHVYDKKCIMEWIHNSQDPKCPVCNKKITSDDIVSDPEITSEVKRQQRMLSGRATRSRR